MEININAPITGRTSYGLVATNIIKALSKLGCRVNAFPIGSQADFVKDEPYVPSALENGREGPYLGAPSIRLYHQFGLLERVGRGKIIGWPIFELDRLNPFEVMNLNSCDQVFVCSQWAMNVCIDSSVIVPISVIPLGVDSEVFYPEEPKRDKPFTFFFPGKYEYRKGFDILLSVLERAFKPTDNFQVLLLPNNPFISQKDSEEWKNHFTKSQFGDKIRVVDRLESVEDVASLTRYSDCVVSFSRAEGWDLPLIEALSCGRNVIATNYSAHTEYLNSTNSILIDVQGREEAVDGVFFNGGGNWLAYSEEDLDQMALKLNMAYTFGPSINSMGVKTAKQFSWENAAKLIMKALND